MTTENRDQRKEQSEPKKRGDALGATPCPHDYENIVRKGRARYHCPKCGADISFDVVMLADAGFYDEDKATKQRNK